jgi:SAM-dependent methyltransferase
MIRLRCPRCYADLPSVRDIAEVPCQSCGFLMVREGVAWDARIDRNYPLDFSRQWALWESGRFGQKRLVYSKTEEEGFADLLAVLGLQPADLKTLKIVEVGYGHGRLLKSLQQWCDTAYGLDLVQPLPSACLRVGSVFCGSLFHAPFAAGQFDVVICQGVIQSTPDARAAFYSIADLVAPDGMLYLYIYEDRAPKSLLLRRVFPWSWCLPEGIRVALSRCLAVMRSLHLLAKQRTCKMEWFREHYDNYTLGFFDILSPRWVSFHKPEDVLSWFKSKGFVAHRLSPCNYIGQRKRD